VIYGFGLDDSVLSYGRGDMTTLTNDYLKHRCSAKTFK